MTNKQAKVFLKMKYPSIILIACALMCLPSANATAQVAVPDSDPFSLSADGNVSLKANTDGDAKDTAAVLMAAMNSPYTPKSEVYNDKDAALKVSMKKETKNGQEAKTWFLEIPDSLMGRSFLAITKLASTPVNFQFVQQEVGEGMYSFFLSPDKKHVLLKDMSETFDTDTLDAISRAVDNSNSRPIVASLKVDTCEGGVYKVDVSGMLMSEGFMSIISTVKQSYRISQSDPTRSTVNSVHSYPLNLEIRTTRTYPVQGNADQALTIGLNTSLILLPKTPMQRRLGDPRMGMNKIGATHFSDSEQKVELTQMITRWRLEPKDSADAARQLRGELIEPRKPIVYYLDPSLPAKWTPYIKEGVAEWQRAFEHAGWKRAIYATEWPQNDSTASMEDARYNVIRMVPSQMSYIFGNSRAWDYRSGEFVNTYILFCQGALTRLRKEYLAQCGAVDSDSHSAVFPDSLMGALIRHAMARAVAPTIGLSENMLASTLTPTDSLRSKAYLRKYSMAPSITDDLPYNYVAQPGDGLTRDELIPRVSDGDDWTVKLAYGSFGFSDPEQERQYLSNMITDSLNANPRLQFCADGTVDAFTKKDDLGDDQIKAAAYCIENLKRIIPYADSWGETNRDFADDYANQSGYYKAVTNQLQSLTVIMSNSSIGRIIRPTSSGVPGSHYSYAPKEYAEKALDLLIQTAGEQPTWLNPEGRYKLSSVLPQQVGTGTAGTLAMELHAVKIYHNNINIDRMERSQKVFDAVMKHTAAGEAPSYYQRFLQSYSIALLVSNLTYNISSFPQMGPIAREISLNLLRQAQKRISTALAAAPDQTTRTHYQMLLTQIDDALRIK